MATYLDWHLIRGLFDLLVFGAFVLCLFLPPRKQDASEAEKPPQLAEREGARAGTPTHSNVRLRHASLLQEEHWKRQNSADSSRNAA